MTDRVIIRRYEPRDRAPLRTVAADTADRGDPVERFFADREVFADLVTRYYTDYEPQAIWVAECDGRVIGYLTGCLDSRRYWRTMRWWIIPQAVMKAIPRGALWSRQAWGLLRDGLTTWVGGGFRRSVPFGQYAAHLHVNVVKGFRGRRVGEQLMERFVEYVKSAGVGGIHAAVRGDNRPACRFFERLGFTVLSCHPVATPDGEADSRRFTRVYAKQV